MVDEYYTDMRAAVRILREGPKLALKSLPKSALRFLARDRGLKYSGQKERLVKRLLDYVRSAFASFCDC